MPAVFVTTADAVDRETAWLTAVDTLPTLVGAGGRWDLVQAYAPRTPAQRKNQIWVLRHSIKVDRFGFNRKQARYGFRLRCWWTMATSTGSAETEQRNFDLAINDVLTRINGLPLPNANKTHGGAFLDVAEEPGDIEVSFEDPDRTLMPSAQFYAEILYGANDPDFTM